MIDLVSGFHCATNMSNSFGSDSDTVSTTATTPLVNLATRSGRSERSNSTLTGADGWVFPSSICKLTTLVDATRAAASGMVA